MRDVFIVEDNGTTYRKVREKDIPAWITWLPSALGFMATDNFSELAVDIRQTLTFEEISKSSTRFVLAAAQANINQLRNLPITIATSYPQLAKRALAARGYRLTDDMLIVNGSVEAARGLVDAIVDVSVTGDSLRANGFEIIESDLCTVAIGAVTARSVNNKALQFQEKGMI